MDRIVFRQEELDVAVSEGARVILLCDNSFNIPLCGGICYRALGEVCAFVDASPSEIRELSIRFDGFEPVYGDEDIPFYANVPHRMMSATDAETSGSYGGSFTSSFSSSFTTSFTTSFVTSGTASFSSSFVWEYGSFGGSFSDSFTVSYRTSFGSGPGFCVSVMGYGIDLI